MKKDTQTIEVYDDQAAEYLKFTSGAELDPALVRFMARLPEKALVLDLGCGPGDHAAAIEAAGFRVVATDASSAMVELARRHLGVVVRQESFEELDETDKYDGVWANFSLLHSTRKEFPNHLARVARAMKQGGILHLAMKTGQNEARDKIGRHYAYYSNEELRSLLSETGFEAIDEVTGESLGLAGDIEPWLILTAKLQGSAS